MKREWLNANRANWDESVAVHLSHPSYDLTDHLAGRGRLYPIEEREIGDIRGQRILHLQCHFGRDTIALAQRGASVVGLDFSGEAIATARRLSGNLPVAEQLRFVQANVYDAVAALGESGCFDGVFVSWGALMWLPDLVAWADIVRSMLRPGGWLYVVEAHPVGLTLGDGTPDGWAPRPRLPYFYPDALTYDDPLGYANEDQPLANSRTFEWRHTLGDILSAIARAGLVIDWVHEHDAAAWRLLPELQEGGDGMFRWPEDAWLPLSWSARAVNPAS